MPAAKRVKTFGRLPWHTERLTGVCYRWDDACYSKNQSFRMSCADFAGRLPAAYTCMLPWLLKGGSNLYIRLPKASAVFIYPFGS